MIAAFIFLQNSLTSLYTYDIILGVQRKLKLMNFWEEDFI